MKRLIKKSMYYLLLLSVIQLSFLTQATIAVSGGSLSITPSATTLTEGKESYPGYLDVVDLNMTFSPLPTDYVTVSASVSGGCKMTDQTKGPVIYKEYTVSITTSGNNSGLGVYIENNSSYEGSRNCTVTFTTSSNDVSYNQLSLPAVTIKVLDDEPVPAKPDEPVKTTTPTTTTTNKNTQSSQPTESNKPATPEVKLVDSTGEELKAEEGQKVAFKSGDPIVLSGKTVPNGVVKLYIFSEPQEAEVTADENGDWTYTIASIEPGDHRVEVEVTDPASGETSDRQEVLSFTVAQAEDVSEEVVTTSTEPVDENSSNTTLYVIIGAGALLAIAGAAAGYLFWKKKKQSHILQQTSNPVSPSANEASENEVDDINTDNQ